MEAAQKDISVLQCSYEDEETLTVALGIFKPQIEVDAIRPDVDVALPLEVSLCPLPVLRLPDSLQADDVCGGEAGGVWRPRSASSAGIMSPVEIPFW